MPYADVPAAKAGNLVVLGAQGVIWLILCRQISILKYYNQLRNAPCSFYTDARQLVHAVVSTGNQYALIHSLGSATGQRGFHYSASQWPFCAEYVCHLWLVQYGIVLPVPNNSYVYCYMPRIAVKMSSKQYTSGSVLRPLVLLLIYSWDVRAGSKRVWL